MPAPLGSALAIERARQSFAEPLTEYPGTINSPWLLICTQCSSDETRVTFSKTVKKMVPGRPAHGPCARRMGAINRLVPAHLAEEVLLAHGLLPLGPYPAQSPTAPPSKQPWPCICLAQGHVVSPRYNSVQQNSSDTACRKCGEVRRGRAKRIPEALAREDMLRAGAQPIGEYFGSRKPWTCLCLSCRREINPMHGNLRPGSSPCVYCSQQRVDVELATALMEAAGATPTAPFPGSDTPWPSLCHRCGRPCKPRYSSIKAGQGPHGACAKYGFRLFDSAWIYVVHNGSRDAIKVGVTNGNRVEEHQRHGWLVTENDGAPILVRVPAGAIALAVERDVLRWWREGMGLKAFVDREYMAQGGHTETAQLSKVPIASLADLIALSCMAWQAKWAEEPMEVLGTAAPSHIGSKQQPTATEGRDT